MKFIENALILTLLILSFTALVHADALVVDPVVLKGEPNATLDLGRVSPGEKIELIFSTDSGYGRDVLWAQAKLGTSSPGIQTTDSQVNADSLITTITVAPYTNEGVHTIPLTLVGRDGVLQDEDYSLQLTVEKNLLHASLSVQELNGRVNAPSTFNVLLVNDSGASATLRIEPSLPYSWAQPLNVTMKPHSFREVPLEVTPRFAGPKTFDIQLARADSGMTMDVLKGTLVANPTLQDRYSAGLYGFPFFTISFVANYLANAFFSFVL